MFSTDSGNVLGYQKAVCNELWHSEDGIFAFRYVIKACEIASAGIIYGTHMVKENKS